MIKSVLTKIRLGEFLAIGWVLFVALVYTIFQQWRDSNLVDDRVWWAPFFLAFLVTLYRYLIPLIIILVRKLRIAIGLLSTATISESDRLSLNFSAELAQLKQMGQFFRDCAPFYFFILFYPSTDFLLNCLQGPATVDQWLVKVDQAVFRVHLSVWAERFISPATTEVLSLCYSLHLILPTIILLFIYLYCRRPLFLEAMQGFMLISIIGFSLYILVPGIGPKYALANLYTRDLAGGFINDLNRVLIDTTRVPRDVFPSLHVAISALMLVYAWRANRWLCLLVLPLTLGNWISTIYLRYHYTIDLVAGFALVPVVHQIVHWWMKRFPEAVSENVEPALAESEPVSPLSTGLTS